MPYLRVYGRKVELHFARVLRFEVGGFEFNDHEATQFQMVEQRVEEEVLAFHFQRVLTAHERKADAQFEQKIADMLH